MIRLAVISDTHNVLQPQVMDIIKSCDGVIHAGDFAREAVLDELRQRSRVYAVRGNNDRAWAGALKDTLRFEIGGVRFFMTHDKRNVDWNLNGVDIVIFGHSHKYFQENIDGRLWLNPGACGRPRFGGALSMAVLEIDEEKKSFCVQRIDLPVVENQKIV